MIYAGQGGGQPQGRFDRYDPATDTWTQCRMPSDTYQRASAVIGGRIYAFGGVEHGGPLNKAEVYDPATDTWSTLSSMPTPRAITAGAAVNGRAYIVGGYFHFGDSTGTAANEAYDPATNSWVARAPMPRPRIGHSVAAVGTKIFVFGGYSSGNIYDIVDVYDTASDSWTTLPVRMPVPRTYSAIATHGTRIMLLGGFNFSGGTLASVDEYDTATEQWTARPPMPTARKAFAAAVVNGTVYAIAGETAVYLTVTEAYGPLETPDTTPPVIEDPVVSGTKGDNLWYISSVKVEWIVSDPESGIASKAGCDTVVLTGDTAGVTLTCSATNGAGLYSEKSTTIKIDTTPPTLTCAANPSLLWPPNNKMTPVTVPVDVIDALPGKNDFVLVSATSNEPEAGAIQGFTTGTASTSGLLKASRLGGGAGRIYSLAYRGTDEAGNAAACVATVTVPHDQGK